MKELFSDYSKNLWARRRLGWPGLWPHTCLYPVSGGLTSKLRHDHCPFLGTAYVDPFARSWLGLTTSDPSRRRAQFYLNYVHHFFAISFSVIFYTFCKIQFSQCIQMLCYV